MHALSIDTADPPFAVTSTRYRSAWPPGACSRSMPMRFQSFAALGTAIVIDDPVFT